MPLFKVGVRRRSGTLPAPTIVNHTTGQADTGTTVTISYTPTAGSNRKLLACLVVNATSGQTLSGVTGNGHAFTAIAGSKGTGSDGGGSVYTEWYYLDDANFWSGAQNIVGTISGSAARVRLLVVELAGAAQGTVDASANNGAGPVGTSLAATITTVAANALILAAAAANGTGVPSPDSPQTQLDLANVNANLQAVDGYYALATAGAQSTSFTWGASVGRGSMAVISVAPA